MSQVISVRFRDGAKNYYFDPRSLQIEAGEYVVVETAQGLAFARCVEGNHEVPDQSVVQPLRPVVRIATDNDHKAAAYNKKREKEAFGICEQKIAAHGLEMKLVNVECNFEGNKIIFFFTADGRVDFRELVKDLAGVFRARIELRQIGVRDEAKMLGGLGICGRPLCCSQFLEEFIPVSIKMAKTQNLSLNPTKISGTCGRLMCCLKYEQAAYEDATRRMPRNESFVDTPDGVGNVSGVDLLQEQVQVRLDSAPESPRRYKVGEIRVLRSGKGSREGIEIPKDRPARLTPEEPSGGLESRFVRRPGREPVSIPSVLAAEPAKEDRRNDRRRNNNNNNNRGRGRNNERSRQQQEKPGAQAKPQRQERPARAEKAEKVEKLPVRPAVDTTAEKKAAADRAAARQQGEQPRQENKNNNYRRFRRRPRNNNQ
ncbi:MAG: stage 0 sporulation family protein [Oscillospiraceae bacterium]|jgi:cell fate regulator YaaT (PSP1 superfamily)|nr:stage 0 sporulation family protein [Oscillospiraceae bacterium]